jgi:hypothetical protein
VSYTPGTSPEGDREVWRLYEGQRPVGFGKRFGSSLMWSKTGAAYSGREIPHSVQVRALPLRTLSGGPIFHGDVVSAPGDETDRYLVLGMGDTLLFARPNSAKFVPRERSGFARRRDFVRHGNVLESARFSRTFDAALRAYAAREFPAGPLAWSLSILTLAGCIVAGLLQWSLRGGIGPITSCVAGIVVGWTYFLGWKWSSPESFRRSTTSRVAYGSVWRTGVLASASYGMAGVLGVPGVAPGLAGVLAGMFAAAVLGVCLAMVAGVLAADSLTRHQDRKLGLPSELRSFLDIPSPFLRVVPREAE